ncbi:MAG: transcriptional repressor [Ruminococcaceae bacterium]|nr:transcriptional repressor [Oscillospiraceae bacterium]
MAYTTKQRTLLSSFLVSHAHSHISMREILDFARENTIGTATVYRYLDKLVQDGQLCKYNIDAPDGGTCFQWRDADCHLYHFVCTDCGKCFHVDCPQLKLVDEHIRENHDFQLHLEKTVFRGHCAVCSERGAK